jgi:hypothetical protein
LFWTTVILEYFGFGLNKNLDGEEKQNGSQQ